MSSNTLPNPPPLPICLEKDRGEKKRKQIEGAEKKVRCLQGLFFFKFPNCLLQFLLPLPTPRNKNRAESCLCRESEGLSRGGCTITAEARAFLCTSPAPSSACSMTHTCQYSGHKAFTIPGPLHIQMPEEGG